MSNVSLANSGRGIVAGFVATIVLSALMLMKQAMGFMLQGRWRCRVFETMGGTSHFALFVQLTFNGHEQASVSGLFTELTK